jgi:GxxExxY protein
MVDLLFAKESYKIIGACFEVHKNLGPGFLEAVYSEALIWEFEDRVIPYEKNKELTVQYKGRSLNKKYYADFVCYDKIILELKAIETISPIHISQVLNYLKATQFRLGLLLNFGESEFHSRQIVL